MGPLGRPGIHGRVSRFNEHRGPWRGRVYLVSFAASRLASQSRDWDWPLRSNSILPLMESPLTFPEYLLVTLFPLNSRVTWKEISSPLILASAIGVSLPRPEIAPVSLSPSSFSLSVVSRV